MSNLKEEIKLIFENSSNKITSLIETNLIQTQEITKLVNTLTESNTNLTSVQILTKLNQLFESKPDLASRIRTELSKLITLNDTNSNDNFSDSYLAEPTETQQQTSSSLLVEIKQEQTVTNAQYYCNKATFYLHRKNFKKSLDYFQKAVEKDSKRAEAYSGIGDAYYYLNNNDEANKYFEQAIKLDINYASAYNGLGLVCADKKEYSQAIEFYNKAIDLNPANGEFYSNKADSLDNLNNDECIQYYEKAIDIDPNDSQFYNCLGLSLKKYKKDYVKAIECFDNAIHLNNTDAFYYHNKGDCLDCLNESDKAIEFFQLAIQLNAQDPDFHNSLGICLKKHKLDFEQALKCFQKACSLDPTNSLFYYNQGEVLNLLDKYPEAIDCIDKSLEIDSNNSECYYLKANTLIELYNINKETENYLKDAIDNYEKSIELNPNDADYYIGLGNAYYFHKNMRKALNCFKKTIELNPNKADAYNGIGQVYNDKRGIKKDYEKAIENYNKAIELDPNNASYFRNKGITYYCMKEYSNAVKCYDRAISLEPNDAWHYFYKGEALKNIKEFEMAKLCFKRAKQLDPNFIEAKKNFSIVNQKLTSLKDEEENEESNDNISPTNKRVNAFDDIESEISQINSKRKSSPNKLNNNNSKIMKK